jgi:HEAT repeats
MALNVRHTAIGFALTITIASGLRAQTPRGPSRVVQLNALASYDETIPPDQLGRVLGEGLQDSDADIRARALAVIAGRSGAPRFSRRADIEVTWKNERPTLQSFESAAIAALDDTNVQVRQQAILALGNLQYSGGRALNDIEISSSVLRAFVGRYDREPSASIRAELVKSVALSSSIAGEGEAFLLRALDDSAPQVTAFAVTGVGRARLVRALPRVVALLDSSNATVRLNAAQALARYGAVASEYASAIRSAITKESDATVLNTLKGTLSTVEGR